MERIGLDQAFLEDPVEVAEDAGRTLLAGRAAQSKSQHAGFTRGDFAAVVGAGFRAARRRVHRGAVAVDHEAVERVLREGRPVRRAEEPLEVGVVLGEQQLRVAAGSGVPRGIAQPVARQPVVSQLGVARLHGVGRDRRDLRSRLTGLPGPGVAEPQRRHEVEGRRLRAAVGRGDPDQDVLGAGLGVLDEDVEVARPLEDAGVGEFELRFLATASP